MDEALRLLVAEINSVRVLTPIGSKEYAVLQDVQIEISQLRYELAKEQGPVLTGINDV